MIKNYIKFIKENLENDTKYNRIIDFTYLKDNVSIDELKDICKVVQENNFYSICVLPKYISTVYGLLENDDIKICTIINYPDGTHKSEQNIKDVTNAISDGADEIDFVMDYKELKQANILENILDSKITKNELDKKEIEDDKENIENSYTKVSDKIHDVSEICHRNGIIIKIILETSQLNNEQIKKACEICETNGVDYIVNSTGDSKQNKTSIDQIEYIRKNIPDYIKIKISGGILTIQDADKISMYADRIGTGMILKNNNVTTNEK